MEKLDIKRGKYGDIEGNKLFDKMKEVLGNCKKEEEWLVSYYGAMDPIKLRVSSKSELEMEIVTKQIPDSEVLDTMRKRNEILEYATGFTAKERLKRLKKKAKEGDL